MFALKLGSPPTKSFLEHFQNQTLQAQLHNQLYHPFNFAYSSWELTDISSSLS